MMEKDDLAFLGKGLQMPFQINPSTGKTEMIGGAENIEKSIHVIMSTKPGERLYHLDFGIDLTPLLFEPADEATLKEIETRIIDGLTQFQPQIIPESVHFKINALEGLLWIDVKFTTRATNTRSNYVYPFYLKEANQD